MKNLIIQCIKKQWRRYTICFLMITLVSLLTILNTHILQKLIDDLGTNMQGNYILLLIGYIICQLISLLFSNTIRILHTKIGSYTSVDIQMDVVKKWFYQNGEFYSNNKRGELLEILNGDINNFTGFLVNNVFSNVSSLFVAISMIIYLATLQADLLIIVLLLQLLIVPFNHFYNNIVWKAAEKKRQDRGKLISASHELLSNMQNFSRSGLYGIFQKSYKETLGKLVDSTIKLTKTSCVHSLVSSFISMVVFASIIGIGGIKISQGTMTYGMLIVFFKSATNLIQPVLAMLNLKTDIQEIKPSINRIIRNIDPNLVWEDKDTIADISNIEIKNLDFYYDKNKYIFDNLNINFEKEKIYTIEGTTGTGKSTLIDLILGLWTPQKGQVLINKTPINEMDIMQLRRSICYIPQEDFIVNGSIEDNVLLYEKEKNNIRSALNDAMLSEYDNDETQNICDGGISISGGERRRIMLARAFMTNASVIILDEPTTGLDSNTEKQVIKNIKKRFKDRLVIIISHSEEVLKSGDIRLRMADQNLIKV